MDSYQVLRLRARVNLGAMAMKGYSAFPKAPALMEPHLQIVSYTGHSAGKRSVHSTAPADWAIGLLPEKLYFIIRGAHDKFPDFFRTGI